MVNLYLFLDIDGTLNQERGPSVYPLSTNILTKFRKILLDLQKESNIKIGIVWTTSNSVLYEKETDGLYEMLVKCGLQKYFHDLTINNENNWWVPKDNSGYRSNGVLKWMGEYGNLKEDIWLSIDNDYRQYTPEWPIYITNGWEGMTGMDVRCIQNILYFWLGLGYPAKYIRTWKSAWATNFRNWIYRPFDEMYSYNLMKKEGCQYNKLVKGSEYGYKRFMNNLRLKYNLFDDFRNNKPLLNSL